MAKKTAQGTSTQSDAVKMLKADHKLIKQLFDQFDTASADEKAHLANRLYHALAIHSTLEEELFYPAVLTSLQPAYALESWIEQNSLDMPDTDAEETQGFEAENIDGNQLQAEEAADNEDLIDQAEADHQQVEEFIQQLKSLNPRGSDYQKLFLQLKSTVLEHIVGEEDLIFPVAMSQLDVQSLGIAMQQQRDNLSPSRAA
jgi:hemerythrin superfamily protein